LLDVHPRTLRIYEEEGFINPHHKGSRRFFSLDDVKWISCLRSMIHDQGISIPGLKRLLVFAPCWEIADCPKDVYKGCGARVDKTKKNRGRGSSKEGEALKLKTEVPQE
jgi:MerR family transcriptional regulator/heat shock protein HspR